jgi:hypothetical protein
MEGKQAAHHKIANIARTFFNDQINVRHINIFSMIRPPLYNSGIFIVFVSVINRR